MPRIVVLANCRAGAGADERTRSQAITKAFAPTGVDPEVRCVDGPALAAVAAGVLREQPDVVVAAGGDGTVSGVARSLAGTTTPMAVLPLGTLNHFARDAGLPLDAVQAAQVAVSGRPEAVDVGEVNGDAFVNNSSIGVYPRAVLERERQQHGRPGSKQLAMVRAAWATLRRLPAHHVRLTIDGRPFIRTTSFVFVGNNLYETSPGMLGRRSTLTGGLLGVHHAKRPGRRAILGLAARALVGRLDGARDLQSHAARSLTIEADRKTMRVALDGEVRRMLLPLQYRIRARALLVMRPPEAPS